MRKTTFVLLGVLVLTVLGLLWFRLSGRGTVGSGRQGGVKRERLVEWRYSTEEEWMVNEIGRDVVEMILFAKDPSLVEWTGLSVNIRPDSITSDLSHYEFEVTPTPASEPISITVTPEPYVWSPDAFAELATTVLRRLDLEASSGADMPGDDLLDRLTDVRGAVIERENQRVSAQLAEDMLNPETHDQAALLLATLSLREAGGAFGDIRQMLCRVSAHLTVSQALRNGEPPGPSGHAGAFAEAALLTLVGRQAEALETLATLEPYASRSTGPRAWLDALKLRNTDDWRLLKEPDKAPLLVRLEHFRALYNLGRGHALEFLDEQDVIDVPDWGRIAFHGSPSVEVGNRFGATGFVLELQEFHEVWDIARDEPPSPERLTTIFNEAPTRCLRPDVGGGKVPEVVSLGTWAGFFQRHFSNQVVKQSEALFNLGLPESVKEVKLTAEETLFTLPLYPLIISRLRYDDLEETGPGATATRAACDEAVSLLRQSPEWVTILNWDMLQQLCLLNRQSGGLPKYTDWFSPALPRGTTFEIRPRLSAGDFVGTLPMEDMERLRALAPQRYDVLQTYGFARTYAGEPLSAEQWADLLSPVLDYDLSAMERISFHVHESDHEEYLRINWKLCEMAPDRCLEFAQHLVGEDRDDDAARAFQRAVDLARDRVPVSTECDWLVDYYYERGRVDEALAIARMAAAVYSAGGLTTYGWMLERLGRYDEARTYYQKVNERYDNDGALTEFYVRYALLFGKERFQEESEEATKRLFHDGIQRASLEDFDGPPTEGVEIRSSNEKLKKLGLARGDVIVALDGYRVKTYLQYRVIRSLKADRRIALIVWHNDSYVEVDGEFTARSFWSGLGSYRAPPDGSQ